VNPFGFGFGLGFGFGYPYYGFGYGYPYYDGYYSPYYNPYYGMGYGYGYPPVNDGGEYYGGGQGYSGGGGGSYSDDRAAGGVRLLVDPTDAQVLVDGNFAGVVDDFNGYTRHLELAAGRHEITLKREGYKTHSFDIYISGGQYLRVRYDMVKGAGEDPGDVVSQNHAPRDMREAGPEGRGGPSAALEVQPRSNEGLVNLEIQPNEATLYVDGAFRGMGKDISNLSLAEGHHRVEVVYPGYKTWARDVDVSTSEPTNLQIVLERP
jgi:hypothetical protein